MLRTRLYYLTFLALCVAFFLFYEAYFSHLLLVFALVPPDSVDYAKLQRLLEKARFSQQGLTEDECREALCICHAMLNALRAAQHGVKKALFCLRFGL